MTHALEASDEAVIAEELALAARVRRAIDRAASRRVVRDGRAAREDLRALRDTAARAREDDLPALLHDLDVAQTLAQRGEAQALPPADTPYFAHLQIAEHGRKVRDYCLGQSTLLDAGEDVRVLDWRTAPLARVFYELREGDEVEEELPARTLRGTVRTRRLVVFDQGSLTRILGDGFVLERAPDGTWGRVTLARFATLEGTLGVGVGHEARAAAQVTALLDSKQFAALGTPAEEALLVLGSAGSGKTTVALHRLARLLASESAEARAKAQVLVPSEGLARLTKRLLAPLGCEGVPVHTLDDFMQRVAEDTFARKLRLCADTPGETVSLKRDPSVCDALEARAATHPPEARTFAALRAFIAEAFTDRVFLAGDGDRPRHGVEATVRHTMAQLAPSVRTQLREITDASMTQALDGREVGEDTPEAIAGTLDLEDLPIALWLRARMSPLDARTITHLVLDEAEDFSLMELAVLRTLVGAGSITLAGDEAQETTSCFRSWTDTLRALGKTHATTCRLSVSYRCPRPIAALAAKVLGPLAPSELGQAARDGAEVGLFAFPEETQAFLFAHDALVDLSAREPHASIAVIAHDVPSASRFFAGFRGAPSVRLVTDGDFSFAAGIEVTHVDAVKGLEFDYVLVPDATASAYPETSLARRRLHVALTRASHHLFVLAYGSPTPFIAFS